MSARRRRRPFALALALAPVAGCLALGSPMLLAGCAAPEATVEEGTVTPLVTVDVGPIVSRTMRSWVEASGVVEPQPATAATPPARASVASPVAGLLATIRCAEGQRVAKGAVLFELDTRVADIAVARAEQAVAFAEKAFERQRRLGAGEATSQRQYEEAEQALAVARDELQRARTERKLLDVVAPLAGTVVAVGVEPGAAVDPTTMLAEIVDLDRLVVSAAVRTAEIGRVEVGQSVDLLEAGGAGTADGHGATPPAGGAAESATGVASDGSVVARSAVAFIGAAVDPATDTVAVRARVPPEAGLRPGQFLRVRILVEERPGRLAVPIESLVSDGAATYVSIVHGDVATRAPVRSGIRDGGFVEIEGEGIEEGATVVTTGAYGLPAEARIRVLEH